MTADTSLSVQVDCVVLVDPVTQSFAYVVLLNVRVASPFAMYFVKKAVLWVRSERTAFVPASAAW